MSEESRKKKDVLATMRKRITEYEAEWADIRLKSLEDKRFLAGDQWPDDVRNARQQANRPCLTNNRLPTLVNSITNEQRQNRPSIKVHPVDSIADPEVAKIYEGLIRHIQYDSGADVAFGQAFEDAVGSGFGYYRINKVYVDYESFDQKLVIQHIPNAFSVYFDHCSTQPDGSDAEWAAIFDTLSEDEFKRQWPDAELSQMADWTSIGDSNFWVEAGKCRVAEYFYKDYRKEWIARVDIGDGQGPQIFKKDEIDETVWKLIPENDKRQTEVCQVKWIKTNGNEILEETDWEDIYIPIIPNYGVVQYVDGKKIVHGIVRQSQDAQRQINYMLSAETEAIALAPKAPYLVAEGQIPPEYEWIWKSLNVQNHAYLPYKPTSNAGQPVGAPQRTQFEPPIMAVSTARAQAIDDLKASTGVFDASIGNRSNENSGIAIARRVNQSQTVNYHFIDNANIARRHCGRILVRMIPKVYDAARAERIIGEEDQQEVIMLNQTFMRKGEEATYNLSDAGQYDVVIETGPSYATKRQEAAANMIELAKALPQLGQVAPDLLVKNLDFPGAHELSERLKKTLPPGLAEDPDQKPIPPEVQAQLVQLQQIAQQQAQALAEAQQIISTKQLELESKERIEFAKMQNQLTLETMKIESGISSEAFKADWQMNQARLNKLDMDKPIEAGNQAGPQGV